MNEKTNKALKWIDDNQEKLFELLGEMIRFDTTNTCGDGTERPLAEYMIEKYRELGLETELFCPDDVPGLVESPLYWPGHNTANRPNALGVRKGSTGEGSVMLAAHTDIMPVGNEEDWTVPPLGGIVKDGRVYGRGSGDDKAGLASAWFALKALDEAGIVCKKDVVLGAYCDEEYGGGNGALGLSMRHPCDDYVNLDAGNFEMWATALGGGLFRIDLELDHITDDLTPIYKGLRAVMDKLDEFGQRRRDELEASPFYKGTQHAKSAFRIYKFGNLPESHEKASVEFVLYTQKSKAEIHAELQGILDDLKPLFDSLGICKAGFVPTTRFFDYAECDTEGGAFAVFKSCAEEVRGKEIPITGSCLTDLSCLLPAGCSRGFNFGILRDFSLYGGAHQPDEFVECKDLVDLTKTLALFLIRYCA